jgi:hypothetical protein
MAARAVAECAAAPFLLSAQHHPVRVAPMREQDTLDGLVGPTDWTLPALSACGPRFAPPGTAEFVRASEIQQLQQEQARCVGRRGLFKALLW